MEGNICQYLLTNCLYLKIVFIYYALIKIKVDASFDASAEGSKTISDFTVKLRPRYHFTALQNTFYERLPYR